MKSGVSSPLFLVALAFAISLLSAVARGARYDVYTTSDLTGLPALSAGDSVVVHDGTYSNVGSLTITGTGTSANPIVISAQNPGAAVFAGTTHIVLSGSWLTFAGFKFDGQTAAGGMPAAEKWGIVQTASGSSDCRITNCMFRDFNDGAVAGNTYYWFVVQGYRHTIDYNSFEGKTTLGASVVFATPESDKTTPRNHLFAFNYFGPRTVIGSNGYEGIRNGDSAHQDWNMASVFQFNYFYRAIYGSGEPELISNKSSNNVYRYNTFVENRGQLSLRHGDNCVVEGNFFFGANLADSGGVRIIGQNHLVRNNYFQDIAGSGTTSTIVVQKGDPNWPASDDASTYEVANNARIFHNTFLNCQQPFYLGRNSSGTGAIDPTGVEVRNNVVQSASGAGAVFNIQLATSVAYSGNYVYHPDGNYGVTGLAGVTYGPGSPGLAQDASLGYAIPSSTSPVLGIATSTTPATSLDIRGLARPASGIDSGCYEREATGTGMGPLARGDVGPAYYGGPAGSFPPPSGGTTITSADGFVSIALPATQSATFTTEFDASSSVSPANAALGLSSGAATAYTGLACMVRFNPSGQIDARNGGSFTGAISFTANTTYHFRLVVNVPAHTYAAYVTAPGGAEQTIGTGLAFRTEQTSVSSLSHACFVVNATPGGALTYSPLAVSGVSAVKYTIPGTSVTASADDGNVPANTVDGNLATRWSAQGNGQWIRYDLGAVRTPAWVRLAFLNGDTRTSTFDVQLSSDSNTWTTVFSGISSGTTTALETYNFPNAAARYLRVVGHGNSANTWNSITETEVWGY